MEEAREPPCTWRDSGECKAQVDPACTKIIKHIGRNHPRQAMLDKMLMLKDFKEKFARRKISPHDACCEAMKNNLHLVKKPKRTSVLVNHSLRGPSQGLRKKASLLLSSGSDSQISELVSVMKSSKFKITEQKGEHGVCQGVATLSCYDKTPREARPDHSEAAGPEPRPGLTRTLEGISIECDLFDVPAIQMGCEELCKQVETSSIHAAQGKMVQTNLCDFSSRFREYCTNTINPELNGALEKFVAELSRLQKNLYNRDNQKGRFRRRYYAGFREIEQRLKLRKIKLVIVAPDLDKNKADGELDELVARFVISCGSHEVPVVFGLSRRKMGYLTHGKGFVSCIGVANYEALEDKLEDVLIKVVAARNRFRMARDQQGKQIDMKDILTDDLLLSERVKVLLRTLAIS